MSLSSKQYILIADDDIDILAALKLLLNCEDYEVTIASTPAQALSLFEKTTFDAVLLDLNFQQDTTSGEEGLQLLSAFKKVESNTPLIVMTGWANINIAVNAMKNGASDFLEKPWDNDRLLSIIATQIKLAQQAHKSEKLGFENQLLKTEQQAPSIIVKSPIMQKVMAQVKQIARSDVPVLITGENGTGKSLLAKQVHELSTRNSHSLINVNMGAIPENLFESEMFGHVKGAFTDAKEQRLGRFELADQGSLFLDEIGNIPLSQQSKLLRVLESQHFEKVGASKTQRVDTRIIAATNANINAQIKDGLFRQDLFYRLNGIEITLPPLRERQEDIEPLTRVMLEKYAHKYQKHELTIENSAVNALKSYAWPGNIRELNHMIERAVILSSNDSISSDLLGLSAHTSTNSNNAFNSYNISNNNSTDDNLENNNYGAGSNGDAVNVKVDATLAQLEQEIISKRIQYHQGNMQNTAKSLGLSRSAFYRRIEKYQL